MGRAVPAIHRRHEYPRLPVAIRPRAPICFAGCVENLTVTNAPCPPLLSPVSCSKADLASPPPRENVRHPLVLPGRPRATSCKGPRAALDAVGSAAVGAPPPPNCRWPAAARRHRPRHRDRSDHPAGRQPGSGTSSTASVATDLMVAGALNRDRASTGADGHPGTRHAARYRRASTSWTAESIPDHHNMAGEPMLERRAIVRGRSQFAAVVPGSFSAS